MTPNKKEVWFEKFWELVDESENYSTIDERITAREKLEEHVTQNNQDMMSEVVEEILVACQKDVDWGEEHQQMVSVRGKAKCLEIIKSLSK